MRYRGWSLLLFAATLFQCRKAEELHTRPVAIATVSSQQSLTTTVFSFNMTDTWIDNSFSNRAFFTWDWNGDGIWDTPLSNKRIFEHRFLVPGDYQTRVMVMDLKGLSDTLQFAFKIGQGYSKPRAKFSITPRAGNPYTLFKFDATDTQDDEDSLETLRFKWDLNGDGNFETGFSNSSVLQYQYLATGIYQPVLEVIDPKGLTNTVTGKVEVTLWDTLIVADFEWSPKFPVNKSPVTFNAGLSHDPVHPEKGMKYKWDWQNDGVFETQWSDSPLANFTFPVEIPYFVRLQVMNYLGLINEVVKEVLVNHKNEPPTAFIDVSSFGGNTQTKIHFDYWDSHDLEDAPSQLLSRWDWNGDGVWDTGFSGEVEVYHTFTEPGVYTVNLEVRDQGGLTGRAVKTISISNSANATDILIDPRSKSGYEYYGIVKIGNQWWFARNLALDGGYPTSNPPYDDKYMNYHDYGFLYIEQIIDNICPNGWRIPTKDDWDKLFSQYDSSSLYKELLPGGESGFNIVLGGMGINTVYPAMYNGKDNYGFFWSQTKLAGQNAESHWIITFDNIKHRVLKGYMSSSSLYSVRCVKDAN